MPRKPLLANRRILVVEDHDDARAYIEIFLRQLGADVITARNAVEGLEAVKIHHPTLVLSDIMMPGNDGFWLLREIRAAETSRESPVPVIAMTALVAPADARRILDVGFRACLPKPFTPAGLLKAIRSVVKD